MAVKIQVKDGFDTNTNCCGLGVAPLTNAYQNIPMLNNTFSGYNNSVQNWPVSAHRTLGDLGDKVLSSRRQHSCP